MSDTKNKSLVIITEGYPYLGQEQFWYNEFIELSKHYKKLIFFPLSKGDKIIANLPENIEYRGDLQKLHDQDRHLSLSNILLILHCIFTELRYDKKGIYFFANFRYNLSHIKQAIIGANRLKAIIKQEGWEQDTEFYSGWMNIGSFILTVAKYKKIISKFCFRINGHDVFEERSKYNYIPFRATNFKHTNAVIVHSKAGLKQVQSKNIFKHKLHYNYSGLFDGGRNQVKGNNSYTIVSCSYVIPLKRVDLIAKAILLSKENIHWIHFGKGPELDKVRDICKNKPSNITIDLKGFVKHEEIIDCYKNHPVDVFINVSTTEGLGMAAIEAQSFGIPAISCNTGGVPEVVTASSGLLLEVEMTPEFLEQKISHFLKHQTEELRATTHDYFVENFLITTNVQKLIAIIEK